MRRVLHTLGWVLVAILTLLPFVAPRAAGPAAPKSVVGRLLGPLAGSLADIQLVRVYAAFRQGRIDLALARAESVFALDPGASNGWIFVSNQLAFDLASPERERDAARRLAWVRAALAIAERGEHSARDPAALIVWQGLVLVNKARSDPELGWPGGEVGLWRRATDLFERAASLGNSDAAALAAWSRACIADPTRR